MKRPPTARTRRFGPSESRRALAAYLVVWLAGAAVVAGSTLALIDGRDEETVALPPVHEIELAKAAQLAGCELGRSPRDTGLNPPVDGAAGVHAAPAGFYDEAPDIGSLTAALRRGVVVIQFRDDLDDQLVEDLRTIQEAVPAGTILTPNATGMRYEVAATAYRRLLGCREFTEAAVDAIQLFRGRWIGSGPDG